MYRTKEQKDQTWRAFNDMQKVAMATGSVITREAFETETEENQKEYYNWMRDQVGQFTAGPYWY